MPLTFEEAKLQYNPDPAWDPKRGSAEYHEILTLMKHSGATFHTPTNKPLEVKDVFKNGGFINPINNRKPPAIKKAISKKEYLGISSNRKAFLEGLAPKEQRVVYDVPEIIVTKATINALKTQAQNVMDAQNRIKKMSKEEFLNMADNREYMRQHILLNKK